MLITETTTLKENKNEGAGAIGLEFNAFQRQKEMNKRESKKKLFISFVEENDINFDYIKNSYQLYLDIPMERRFNGKLKFEEFCEVEIFIDFLCQYYSY